MSRGAPKGARPETVALTRSDIDMIVYDTGWGQDAADAFWEEALKRTKEGA